MTNAKEIIIMLKEVREEKHLSYSDILDLMEKNGDYVSKSTLSRVFSDGSENDTFRFEDTIRPIANALLDLDNLEDTDDINTKTMKKMMQYKLSIIETLEKENADLKAANEKYKKDNEHYERLISFLQKQVDYKDDRMDKLLEAVFHKDEQLKDLMERVLSCQKCREINHEH